jgi:short-subunit dehydrogenase
MPPAVLRLDLPDVLPPLNGHANLQESSVSKLVFITGASSGIGQALALRFFQAGYKLALVARRTDQVQSWAQAHGISAGSHQIYSADVSISDSIVAAGQACIANQGIPDVVIANAGISIGMDTAVREDLAVMAQTFATNNIGLAATFHPFVNAMVQRGSGALVGIGSVAGIRGLPGHGAYCASKAAVISYCESLRGEVRSSGVKVVTLCPGYIDTPLTQKNRYAMPFLMQPEAFADKAFAAIEAGASYRVIPWQMGVVAKLLRLLPNPVFDKALAGRPRKHRKDSSG